LTGESDLQNLAHPAHQHGHHTLAEQLGLDAINADARAAEPDRVVVGGPLEAKLNRRGAGLAKALESPNGTLRELAHQQIVWSADKATVPGLRRLVRTGSRPQTRVQAMAALAELGRLAKRDVVSALDDTHPAVRRHAIRLGEALVAGDPDWVEHLAKRADDPDSFVRQQLAYSLGQATQSKAGKTLAKLLLRDAADPYLAAAILSAAADRQAIRDGVDRFDSGERTRPRTR